MIQLKVTLPKKFLQKWEIELILLISSTMTSKKNWDKEWVESTVKC